MSQEVQLAFDYRTVDAETREFLQDRAERIHKLARATAAGIVKIGEYLTEVKERMPGRFLEWIKAEFGWQKSSAYRFMQVYENVKLPNLGNGEIEIDVSALYLIAAPKTPEPVRREAIRQAAIGPVTHATVKAVVAEYQKTGNGAAAVGQLFDAVRTVQRQQAEERKLLPSPAEARRTAIATGAHTLDRNGTYQPPLTVEDQADYKADMMFTDPAYQFCKWVGLGELSAPSAARIITARQWKRHYRNITRAIAWLTELQELLQ